MVIPEVNNGEFLCPLWIDRAVDVLFRVLITFGLGIYAVCTILVAMDWGLEVIPILLREKMGEFEERDIP